MLFSRALLEREYGQKLMKLNKLESDDDGIDNKTTHAAVTNQAVKTIYREINKSAQSHIDMANRLEQEVAIPLKDWISTHRNELNTVINIYARTIRGDTYILYYYYYY